MRRFLVFLAVVLLCMGAQVAGGPPASAGCQGAQSGAYPCWPHYPCGDPDRDGYLDCVSVGDALVDALP